MRSSHKTTPCQHCHTNATMAWWHTTHPQPHEQLLMGWIAGGIGLNGGNDGGTINRQHPGLTPWHWWQPAPPTTTMSNCSQSVYGVWEHSSDRAKQWGTTVMDGGGGREGQWTNTKMAAQQAPPLSPCKCEGAGGVYFMLHCYIVV